MKKIGCEAVFEIAEALAAAESDSTAISACLQVLACLPGNDENKSLSRLARGMEAKLEKELQRSMNAAQAIRLRIGALRVEP